MSPVAYIIIAIVVLLVGIIVTALVTKKVAVDSYIKSEEQQLGSAQDRAKQIVDEALKNAETTKREALLEAKEEAIKTKNEIERESKERRAELQRYEERVLSKEESLDKKSGQLERKEAALNKKDASLDALKEELEHAKEENLHKLEEISGLTSEQAKEYLLKSVEEEVKHETAVLVKELDRKAKEEADKRAKDYVVNAIQRCAADHAAETTISVVQLPNDEMKGRIIGREGRNIRTLEQLTGVDLIIDDTPEAVIISAFDGVRREVARVALEKLIVDGRIHPARIEETVIKAQKEVESMIREEGEAATLEVAHLSGLLAAELGENVRIAKRAGLLHDIGKAVDQEIEGTHIQIGADLCRKYKESKVVINAVEAHHGDVEPESIIACIVQAADAISAGRPGAGYGRTESGK